MRNNAVTTPSALSLLQDMQDAAGSGVSVEHVYSQFAGDSILEAWKDWHGLRESSAMPTVERLMGLKGRGDVCVPIPRAKWRDHMSIWNRNGEHVVLVSQPYQLSQEALEELSDLVTEHDLYLHVSPEAWHFNRTLRVEVWRSREDFLWSKHPH